jgi:hypothetical protein
LTNIDKIPTITDIGIKIRKIVVKHELNATTDSCVKPAAFRVELDRLVSAASAKSSGTLKLSNKIPSRLVKIVPKTKISVSRNNCGGNRTSQPERPANVSAKVSKTLPKSAENQVRKFYLLRPLFPVLEHLLGLL